MKIRQKHPLKALMDKATKEECHALYENTQMAFQQGQIAQMKEEIEFLESIKAKVIGNAYKRIEDKIVKLTKQIGDEK